MSTPVRRDAERDRDRQDEGGWREAFGEQRWLVVAITIAGIIAIGVALIASRRAGQDTTATDPTSATMIMAAEPGSSLTVSRDLVPTTQLRTTPGEAGAAATLNPQNPQSVMVLDEDVLFDFDRADLRGDAQAELDRIVQAIRISGSAVVDVVGYTDSIAPQEYNLQLSRARAETVADYLTSVGITANRLDVDWRGELDPVAPNADLLGRDNPAGRQLNRRVEIRMNTAAAPIAPAPPPGTGRSDVTPEGSRLSVDAVDVGGTYALQARFRFVNAGAFPVELAGEDMWLVDDRGVIYRFSPTWQNPTIVVPAGATMTGELVFPGIPSPTATAFTLVTNAKDPLRGIADPDRRARDTTPNLVVVQIPATR